MILPPSASSLQSQDSCASSSPGNLDELHLLPRSARLSAATQLTSRKQQQLESNSISIESAASSQALVRQIQGFLQDSPEPLADMVPRLSACRPKLSPPFIPSAGPDAAWLARRPWPCTCPVEPVLHVWLWWSSSPTRRRVINLEMSDRFKFALGLRGLRRLSYH